MSFARIGVLLLLGACVGPGPKAPVDTAADDTGKPAPIDDLTVDGLTVAPATVPTVLRAQWRTAEPTRSDVTATFGDEVVVASETEATTDHDVVLVGFPALTPVHVRVTADGTDASAEIDSATGANPSWVPDLDFAADAPQDAEGGVTLTPVILPGGGGILGVDAKGRVVWSWPQDDAGFPWPPFRAAASLDGTSVLYNHMAPSAELYGPVMRVSVDGTEVVERAITGGHTDFVEYTDGGYLTLGWDIREFDGRRILADTIVELSPEGVERVVWSAWDSFQPNADQVYPNLYPADVTVEDWTHINGISYSAEEDAVYVTATFNNSVIRVDRATGQMTWWVSDFQGGNFENTDAGERIVLPHSVQRIDGGITVFSRGNPADPTACSEVWDIALDEESWEQRGSWSYTAPNCLLVPYLGGAERLPGGNTLISWTTAGQLDEVTPDGEIAWQVSTSIGAAFGFTTRTPRLGP